jgi:predicted RNase H-like HicB family nuclease
MARDAIQAYLESLIKDGEKIPEEKEARQEKVAVSVEASS